MKKLKLHQYTENFWLRKRTHTILPTGVRTESSSFVSTSDQITEYKDLGKYAQYHSDYSLMDLFIVIGLFGVGVKGLTNAHMDEILFAISLFLILLGFYFLIKYIYDLKYIGSFYFSNPDKKAQNVFEIKAKYPPNQDLASFIAQILKQKRELEINKLLEKVQPYSNFKIEKILAELDKINDWYDITEKEIEASEQLVLKLHESQQIALKEEQKKQKMKDLVHIVSDNRKLEYYIYMADEIKNTYDLTEEEYSQFIEKIKEKFNLIN